MVDLEQPTRGLSGRTVKRCHRTRSAHSPDRRAEPVAAMKPNARHQLPSGDDSTDILKPGTGRVVRRVTMRRHFEHALQAVRAARSQREPSAKPTGRPRPRATFAGLCAVTDEERGFRTFARERRQHSQLVTEV